MLDLAMSDNPEEVLTPQIKSSKYGRVHGRDIIILFEKYVECQ